MNQKQRRHLSKALEVIRDIIDEETEKLSNLEDYCSGSERYEKMEETIGKLNEAADVLEEVAEGE